MPRGALELRASGAGASSAISMRMASPQRRSRRIEVPLLRREDVHDEREEIHQDPFRAIVAFDVRRTHAGCRSVSSMLSAMPYLPAVLAGAHHEEVGERRRVTKVEHDDVRCLLVERRSDRARDFAREPFPAACSFCRRACAFLCHASELPSRAPAYLTRVKPMLSDVGFD